MDPALLREREAFKKRALSNPVVESKKKEANEVSKKKPKTSSAPKQTTKGIQFNIDYHILSRLIL